MIGCSNQGDYQMFTARNTFCSFSVEYPSTFDHTDGPRLDVQEEYFSVGFAFPEKEYQMVDPALDGKNAGAVTVYHTPAYISIFISKSDRGFTAKTLVEDYLDKESSWADYELLERSTMIISGINAEYAHFVDSSLLPMLPAPGKDIPLKHYIWAYFDYNDLIWQIEVEYDEEMAKQIESDFEHVIQTFKLLDNN
jgi:hypothetical protein